VREGEEGELDAETGMYLMPLMKSDRMRLTGPVSSIPG
jgi:hypothetical protein